MPLVDPRYNFRISKNIILVKKYTFQYGILRLLVAALASHIPTVQLTRCECS